MAQWVLQHGVLQASHLPDAPLSDAELQGPNAALAFQVRNGRLEIPQAAVPQARIARSRTKFSAGSTPYKTGTRCCTAVHQYRRCRVCPTDEPAKLRQSQGTTDRLVSSSSST